LALLRIDRVAVDAQFIEDCATPLITMPSEEVMRKIVTGTVDGRSRVIVDETIAQDSLFSMLWDTSPTQPLGAEPIPTENAKPAIAPGHSSWRVVALPPEPIMRVWLQQGIPGLDERGFHLTDTIDYIVVLDGSVVLALDDGEVELQPGDLVVQRQTNHAWFNRNDFTIRLLCLLVGV